MLFIFLTTTRMDATTSYIMAQSTALELPHLDDEPPLYPYQETATILTCVIAEQKGSTNPTHRAVLFLLELRADLEHRYLFVDLRHESRSISQNIDDAMHLSADFLQNITDLDGSFALTVVPCLDMAKRIRQMVDTFADLKIPDGIAKIKRIRVCQLTRLHHLQERWEDMLQTAREFDESVTFRRLSDIVESTEDTVAEAWLYAQEFIDSCEADVQHQPNISFPATPNTLSPLQPTAATGRTGHVKSQSENPKLTVLHHTPATNVSRVNTTAVCATIAHHGVPNGETPPPVTPPRRYTQSTDDDTESFEQTQSTDIDTASLPSLDPDHGKDIAATDPTETPEPVTSCYLNDLTVTLGTQIRRVDREKNDAKLANKTVLAEIGTLMIASRDTIEKAAKTSMVEPTYPNSSNLHTPKETPNDTSEWCSPMTFVPIASGGIRSVVDLLQLNNYATRRSCPTNTINDPTIAPQSDGDTYKGGVSHRIDSHRRKRSVIDHYTRNRRGHSDDKHQKAREKPGGTQIIARRLAKRPPHRRDLSHNSGWPRGS